jgi:hypothetical protein
MQRDTDIICERLRGHFEENSSRERDQQPVSDFARFRKPAQVLHDCQRKLDGGTRTLACDHTEGDETK